MDARRAQATSIHINSRGQVTLEKLSKARVAVAVGLHGLRLVIAALLARPRRLRDSSSRNIRVAAAASPRLVSAEYPRDWFVTAQAWVGCVYLGRTIDPGDLILNAVALEFILNVDDLIFTCFAPKRFRALVKHAKTLESPSFLPSRRGLNLGAVCTLFVVMSGLMGLYQRQRGNPSTRGVLKPSRGRNRGPGAWIVRGDKLRRRRGCRVDIPRKRCRPQVLRAAGATDAAAPGRYGRHVRGRPRFRLFD